MSFIIKELVKNRLKNLTVPELLHYANDYGFSISEAEAKQVLHYVQASDFDVFSKDSINDVYHKIAQITDVSTANQAKALLEEIVRSYGLENYFY